MILGVGNDGSETYATVTRPQGLLFERKYGGNTQPRRKNMSPYYTVDELSEILQVKPKTIHAWVEAGLIPHHKFGRLTRFERTEIQQWQDSNRKRVIDVEKMARSFLRPSKAVVDVDAIAKKIIAEQNEKVYSSRNGKPGKSFKGHVEGGGYEN
jgi:excisionase family DNA binding protein